MPKYLFTSDLRISHLSDKIQYFAKFFNDGGDITDIQDKSENNNANTLKFYFNLHKDTEICQLAEKSPKDAIRNFITKFQFPNPRTKESLKDSLDEGILLAPYRTIIQFLDYMASTQNNSASLTFGEILYWIFCFNDVVCNPFYEVSKIVSKIQANKSIDYESLIEENIVWKQYKRQSRELITVLTYSSKCFSINGNTLIYNKNHPDYLLDKDFINEVLSYKKYWIPSENRSFEEITNEYISYMDTRDTTYNIIDISSILQHKKQFDTAFPLQQIFFGAPGTGKSHTIKKTTDKVDSKFVFRTTFHPDSDYSTFVGAYKPKMEVLPRYNQETGEQIGVEKRIVYAYTPQAFLKAYTTAWNNPEQSVFLIIEEINRGNCAQIFGDIFQLLDRGDDGESCYPIKADQDMQMYLMETFTDNASLPQNIQSGEELILPSNLYIWATMNTSDQSLFPIDSAFKRRWEWKYRPIIKGRDKDGNELNWRIKADTREYDWWSFLEKINAIVGTITNSEDKKLGFFFCKPTDDVISAETFVNKVIFYLYTDVFKDFGFDNPIFKDYDSSTLEFDKFYTTNANGDTIVLADKVETFLENLKVTAVGDIVTEVEDEDGNTSSSSTRDYTKYSINGVGKYGKNILAAECVKEYIKLNPEMSVEDVLANWKSLGYIVPHFVESKEEHDNRTDNSIRSVKIPCGDTFVYVEKNGYGNNGAAEKLISAVNQKDWNIKIDKV